MKTSRYGSLASAVAFAMLVAAGPAGAAVHKAPAAKTPAASAPATSTSTGNTSAASSSVSDIAAPTIDTTAAHAIVIDYNTGTVLLDKTADERIEPASLAKMMTMMIVFQDLKSGQIKLDDTFSVSEAAWRTGGSKMFVPLGARVKVEDLVRGMIIDSGNDACVVLAEGAAGSTETFLAQENAEAQKLGLKGTHYADVNGLPDPQEYTTPRDLSILATHLIHDFPEYYHYFAEKTFTYGATVRGKPITQGNRNPLLYKDPTVDGLKTGHTEEAGYGVTVSALRNGRRILEVLTGMHSMNERSRESQKLLEWAYHTFNDYTLVTAGKPVDEAAVWLGQSPKVPVTAAKDVVVTLPRSARPGLKVKASYDGEVRAPVAQGQSIGTLDITAPGMAPLSVPLIAAQADPEMNPLGRVATAAGYLLWGKR